MGSVSASEINIKEKPSLISPRFYAAWLFPPTPSLIPPGQSLFQSHSLPSFSQFLSWQANERMTHRWKQDLNNYCTVAGCCLSIILFLPIIQVLGLLSLVFQMGVMLNIVWHYSKDRQIRQSEFHSVIKLHYLSFKVQGRINQKVALYYFD